MQKFVMLIGIPGSGKSTYAAQYLRQFQDIVYVSSDEIRLKLFNNEEYQKDNVEVFAEMKKVALEALKSGKSVLWDSTNILEARRKEILAAVSEVPGTVLQAVVFKVPMQVCLERNARRKRKVPELIIRRMWRQIQLPKDGEGYQRIRWIYK